MINVNKGAVDICGTEAVIVAEVMCLIKNFIEMILIRKWGSKEKAKDEIDRNNERSVQGSQRK